MLDVNQVALMCVPALPRLCGRDSASDLSTLSRVLLLFPFAHLFFLSPFCSPAPLSLLGEKTKIYPFTFLTHTQSPVSIPSPSRWLWKCCWCCASYSVREYCHEVGHKGLPLPAPECRLCFPSWGSSDSLHAFSQGIYNLKAHCCLFLLILVFCFFWHHGFQLGLWCSVLA